MSLDEVSKEAANAAKGFRQMMITLMVFSLVTTLAMIVLTISIKK